MIEKVECKDNVTLEDYAGRLELAAQVRDLRAEAGVLLPRLQGRRLVMVNSTARGGGVAEMLPKMILQFRELGMDAEWFVMGTDDERFFDLTKRLHNMIHGDWDGREFTDEDRKLYEQVNRANADELKKLLRPDDILVVHDPQPMALGNFLKQEMGLATVWRCHIGLDSHVPATRAAWGFLKKYSEGYDRGIFSAPEYIPDFFAGRSHLIYPALDPLSHKNRDLPIHKLTGILSNSGLIGHPPRPTADGGMDTNDHVLTPPFEQKAMRLSHTGEFIPADTPPHLSMLFSPVITQVSRWDRLKGFRPLLDAFVLLKKKARSNPDPDPRKARRNDLVQLLLVGPDPASIQDDPEGREALEELVNVYVGLDEELKQDIALVTLPMESRKQNALMVNALQRCSTIVAQNSVREGFGLTVAEAMWKGVPVLGSMACGIRQQIRHGVDGLMIRNPEDPEEIAAAMAEMLHHEYNRSLWGRNGKRRTGTEFLIFKQMRRWISLLAESFGP